MYPPRRRSPSPLQGRHLRLGAREEIAPEHSRDVLSPGTVAPLASLQPQAVSSRRFAAASNQHGPTFLSISGGSLLETAQDTRLQEFRLGPRPRPLTCLAASPCGDFWAVAEACSAGRPSQVLVVGRKKGHEIEGQMHVGPRRVVRQMAWAASSGLLAAVVETETDQAGAGEQQLVVWSWPQCERLAATTCGRNTKDLAGAPEAAGFLTVGPCGAKIWTIAKQDARATSPRAVRREAAALSTNAPMYRLVGASIPLSVGANAGDGMRSASTTIGKRRQSEDALTAATCGAAKTFFLATRQGRLGLCTVFSVEVPQRVEWRNMGRKVFSLSWSQSLCGRQSQNSLGFLICALASGVVEVLDAHTMRTLYSLSSTSRADAIGLSISPDKKGLWALYADRSMAYFASLAVSQAADWNLTSLAGDFRHAQSLPLSESSLADTKRVITASPWKMHLWRLGQGKLSLEAQTESASLGFGEITALATSIKLVACGHSSGMVRLMLIASSGQLAPQEPMPEKHSGEVCALSFGAWKAGSVQPLLLTSVSLDRTAMVFSIEFAVGLPQEVHASRATLLYRTQPHPLPLLRAALLVVPAVMNAGYEVVRLAVCTAEQFVLRELELKDPGSIERRACTRQAPRFASWVGVCAHPARMLFFTACSDRRVLKLDQTGRPLEEVRFGGTALHMELTGPMQLSHSGKLLAVAIAGTGGIMVLNVEIGLQPIARMTAGQAEPSTGLALLPGEDLLSFWQDGTVLQWKVPSEEVPSAALREGLQQSQLSPTRAQVGTRRRIASPRATAASCRNGTGARGSNMGLGMYRNSPSRGRQGGPVPTSAPRGFMQRSPSRPLPTSPLRYSRRSGPLVVSSGSAPVVSETKVQEIHETLQADSSLRRPPQKEEIPNFVRAVKASLDRLDQEEVAERVAAATEDCPINIEQLMASSPSPPRWAEAPEYGEGPPKPDMKQPEEGRDCTLMGKWARGSLVGAQVRSASDLHRVAPRCSAYDMQVRSASEGAQARSSQEPPETVRQLQFSPPVHEKPLRRKLPPKPTFPPPTAALDTCDDATMTSVSSVSTALPAVESTSSSIIPTLSHVVHERGCLSLPTPSRKRLEPVQTKTELRQKLKQVQQYLRTEPAVAEGLLRECLEAI